MRMVPAALFLADFGNKEPAAGPAEVTTLEALAVGSDSGASEQIDAAHARGLEEGRTAAEAEALERLEEQKAAAEQTLAAAREQWCSEEGARIAEQVETAFRGMEDRIADACESILKPFLAQAVRDQALRELRAILQELVAANPGITLEISGPEDLLSEVRAGLSAAVATVSYVANEACDVQVKAGASVLETRLSAWLTTYEGQIT